MHARLEEGAVMHEVLVPAHPGTSMCKSVAVTCCLPKEIIIVPTVQATSHHDLRQEFIGNFIGE